MNWTDNIVKRTHARKKIDEYIKSSMEKAKKELQQALLNADVTTVDVEIQFNNYEYSMKVFDREVRFNLEGVIRELIRTQKYNTTMNIEDLKTEDVYQVVIAVIKNVFDKV